MESKVRIDIGLSVLSNAKNEIEKAKEEVKLRQQTGQFLHDLGYERFVVVGGDMISDDDKKKLVENFKIDMWLVELKTILECDAQTQPPGIKEVYLERAKQIEEFLNQR